ncbi:hypothetical protein GGX14DRAFT_446280 [Mycena pura]|uniref:MYND-type domain-containing protein n=1 Tax=Mycena pura TaxID=153505 RepID=A0AAD6VJ83_9AGAR|nr:hypothetical protein GGX14DRAFT_446280 [Mycena pura]
MPFELNRQEIVDLLALVGVEIPARTRLTDEKLDKRLTLVLDSCQYISRVVPNPPLVPSAYPLWNGVKPLDDAIIRTNADEASLFEKSRAQGIVDPIPMHTNAFRDLRHSLKEIAIYVNKGYSRYAFQDSGMASDIRLKVLLATLKEQHLLLRLLRRNSKRIESTYQPTGRETAKGFELSFLLPVGPLSAKDRGKHNTIEGCPSCGETAPDLKKCTRCLSVSYCSKECQRLHWGTHRLLCDSVSSGTWKEITVHRPTEFNLNRYDIIGHPDVYDRSFEHFKTTPPENVHGTQPFIVKIQLAAADASNLAVVTGQRVDPRGIDGQSMLIYDRQRSIEFTMDTQRSDPVEFNAVAGIVKQKGERGLRVFCWATRSGDWTLRLCLDHLPEQQKW